MTASAKLSARALNLQAGDKALVCLSTEHVAGVMMLVRGLELGLSMTVLKPTSNPLAGFPDTATFDFAAFVPFQLHEALEATPAKRPILNRMRAILVGGTPISEALLKQISTLDAPVYHTYGMTETVSHIALRRLNGPQASEYFTPLEGVQVSVNSQDCLVIQSVLTRYETLVTNDRVELKENGSFRWLGRIDNIINTGGIKVQAEKVEAVLETFFQAYHHRILASRRCCVGPLPHPRFSQVVVAVIEGKPIPAWMQTDIREKLLASNLLDKYEIPMHFYFKNKFLETSSGKIDRQANLAGLSVV
jgi:O-succinylbenzoic acid--CoA ligase